MGYPTDRQPLSLERGRPDGGQGLRPAWAAEEFPQPPKTANVEILGGYLAGASHGPDELAAAIHRPDWGLIRWGVMLRGFGLQSLKLKRLALPGDGSLMVAHWPGPEEGRSCRKVLSIVKCGTRVGNRRDGQGGVDASASSGSVVAAESAGGSSGPRPLGRPPEDVPVRITPPPP
jgi:hypothetical protein